MKKCCRTLWKTSLFCPALGAKAADIISTHIAGKMLNALKELHLR